MSDVPCRLCGSGESTGGRYVWSDRLWRLWTRTTGQVPGYSFLTPRRHIPYITDLDGDEAATLGAILSRVSAVIRDVTGASLIYLHVFGDGAAHLHVHVVPHTSGDALSTQVVRDNAAEASADELHDAADRIARAFFAK